MRYRIVLTGIFAIVLSVTLCGSNALAADLSTATSTSAMRALQANIQTGKAYIAVVSKKKPATPRLVHTLHQGSSGDEVRALQGFLMVYGALSTTTPLGQYGPITKRAVETFQQKNGLEPVGTVGPRTRARILALSAQTLAHLQQTATTSPSILSAAVSTDIAEDGSSIASGTNFSSTTPSIFATVTLQNALQTTEIGYIRYFKGVYVDSGVTHPNRDGLRYAHIQWSLAPGKIRAVGPYRIDFFVDGTYARSAALTIQ